MHNTSGPAFPTPAHNLQNDGMSLRDYFAPLDGCSRCGYAYERETGYFLLAIWAINYGVGSLIGISLYFYLEWNYHLDLPVLIASVVLPVVGFNFFFAFLDDFFKAFVLGIYFVFDWLKEKFVNV